MPTELSISNRELADYTFIRRNGVTNPAEYGPCADDIEVALWSMKYLGTPAAKYHDLVGFKSEADAEKFKEWDAIREVFAWENLSNEGKYRVFPAFSDLMDDIENFGVEIPKGSRVKIRQIEDGIAIINMWIWFREHCSSIPYTLPDPKSDPSTAWTYLTFKKAEDAVAFKLFYEENFTYDPDSFADKLADASGSRWVRTVLQHRHR